MAQQPQTRLMAKKEVFIVKTISFVKIISSLSQLGYFCSMFQFLNKYRAAISGLVLNLILVVLSSAWGLILIDPSAIVENTVIFMLCWISFSLIIYKIPYLRKNSRMAYMLIDLILLMFIAMVIDSYLNIPDNPITIALLILFWLGVGYILLPGFFTKYRLPLFFMYGILMLYFLYIRLQSDYLDTRGDTLINLLIGSLGLLFVLWIFEQWKWFKTLKDEKAKAELALLRSQINPHFFFNTLNNLYGLTVEKSEKAPQVVLKLSEMMRYTIYEGKKEVVSLKDELVYLKNYIALHQLRYRTIVDIDFQQSLDKDYEITPLLFIILLENAFKHGVERKMENAYIRIQVSAKEYIVTFRIENNLESSKSETSEGIGLENLQRRLELIYPDKHTLNITMDKQTYTTVLQIDLK